MWIIIVVLAVFSTWHMKQNLLKSGHLGGASIFKSCPFKMLTNELQFDVFPEPMGLWVMNTSKYKVDALDAMIKCASCALLETA